MKYLICNLKANKNYEDMLIYKQNLEKLDLSNINFILAPTSIYLPLFKKTNISLCSQNINLNNNLNLTGDISIEQLKSLDIKYVLVGHYERRNYYKENEQTILEKIKICLNNNLKIIYCIGESKEENARQVTYQVLERQIARIFNKLTNDELKNIIIAYEPAYLIGTDSAYDILKIRSIILFLKKLIKDYYNINTNIIFGGNVNGKNIDNLLKLNIIDGFIICSAILNPNNLNNLIAKISDK